MFEFFGDCSLDAGNPIIKKFVIDPACKLVPEFCDSMFFLFCGWNKGYINETRIGVYAAHQDCTSTMTFNYGVEIIKSGIFQKYDYGSPEKNKNHYGVEIPPEYDISKIHIPMTIYYGGEDWLVKRQDVEDSLLPRYGNVKEVHFIKDYNHGDFIYGTNAHTVIYDHVLEIVQNATA